METAIFRIMQEGLSNIHRHSGSSTASIILESKEGQIFLQIKDRGRGMPVISDMAESVDSGSKGAKWLGIGITGMRQRLRQFGGRLELKSNEQGTAVTAIVPLIA
jgi:signal transduction histidine kinase